MTDPIEQLKKLQKLVDSDLERLNLKLGEFGIRLDRVGEGDLAFMRIQILPEALKTMEETDVDEKFNSIIKDFDWSNKSE